MATNVTEKDKALQEKSSTSCTNWSNALYDDKEGGYENFVQADALTRVICKCRFMLGSGSMPSEVPNQSEDVK